MSMVRGCKTSWPSWDIRDWDVGNTSHSLTLFLIGWFSTGAIAFSWWSALPMLVSGSTSQLSVVVAAAVHFCWLGVEPEKLSRLSVFHDQVVSSNQQKPSFKSVKIQHDIAWNNFFCIANVRHAYLCSVHPMSTGLNLTPHKPNINDSGREQQQSKTTQK